MPHLNWLPLLILLVPAVLARLNRKPRAQPDRSSQPPREADEDERTRQIREQVRRRIAERRGQPTIAPPLLREEPMPEEVAERPAQAPRGGGGTDIAPIEPFGGPARAPDLRDPGPGPASDAASKGGDGALRRQESSRMPAKLADGAERRPRLSPMTVPVSYPEHHPWLAEFRDRSSLKKFVVMREVLGPPVALR